MIEGVVYRYVSPEGKSYVGQTTDEKRRRRDFLRTGKKFGLPDRSYRGKSLRADIYKFGAKNFTYEVLFRGRYTTVEEAQLELWEKEKFFIQYFDSYHNGYNQTLGGNDSTGFKHSEKTKRILSKLASERIGEKAAMYGKHLSGRQKQILSECAKQRTGDKNPFFGKVHNESTKRKISEANSVPVLQIDAKTNEVIRAFSSAIEAGKSLGNPRLNSEIIKCCKGYVSPSGRHYLTCKGYKWKYQE